MQRRTRLLAQMDSTSAMVLRAADARIRSNDVAFPYRQESNFLYLTGWTRPNAYLMLVPRGVRVDDTVTSVILFVSNSTGGADADVPRIQGGKVVGTELFDDLLHAVLQKSKTIYVSAPDVGFVNDWLNGKRLFLDRESRRSLEQAYPGLKVKNASSLVAAMRRIKGPSEVEEIRRAIALTGDGIKSAMSVCRPGAMEYGLQAAIEYEMIRQGASFPGFPSIVGSGENSLILHYDDNTRQMHDGEVVVIDVGAEFHGYSADITRTIPVSGRFTKEQRDAYELVFAAQAKVLATVKAGVTFAEIERAAREIFAARGFEKFNRHGVSHHLGLDVHDVGLMDTLRAGMVITVEPGVYFPKADTTVAAGYRGWGLRIEDDVLVTGSGGEVLSQQIPKTVSEIESLMKKGKQIRSAR